MNPIVINSEENDIRYSIIDENILTDANIQFYYVMNEDSKEKRSIIEQNLSVPINFNISDVKIDVNLIADSIQAIKCKYCNFICENNFSIIAHCKEEHIEKFLLHTSTKADNEKKQIVRYVCGICSKPSLSLDDCQQHMILDHNFKNALPDIENNEDIETNIKKTMKDSIRLNDDYWSVPRSYKEIKAKLQHNRIIRCTERYCVYKFDSNDAMVTHKSCHNIVSSSDKSVNKQSSPKSNHSYICTICRKKFVNWPNCSLHLWKSHSIQLDLLTCPICLILKTHSVSKMNQHLVSHWRKISNEANCTVGVSKLVDSEENLSRWYANKKCDICLKMFSNSKTLKKHIQAVHKKIKPFSCNVCGHSSSSKHTLQLHIRQHTGEKPYFCDVCDYRTGDHNTLRRHKMKHSSIRPYKCPYCMYSSIQSMPLRLHLKSQHSEKPLPDRFQRKYSAQSKIVNENEEMGTKNMK